MRTQLSTLASVLLLSACGNADRSRAYDGDIGPAVEVDAALATEALEEDIVALREEEKLARDVYLTLLEVYDVNAFVNISGSEQRHMDRVGELLQAFGIDDPVTDDSIGAFKAEAFEKLYGQLVASGRVSLADALRVGATIEDLDIHDIQEMRERTGEPAARATYDALECGSRNHMRAFVRQLTRLSESYEPQFISQEQLDEILGTPQERCGDGAL